LGDDEKKKVANEESSKESGKKSGKESAASRDGGGRDGGGSLGQTLFELFHSYLEGDVGTPSAATMTDGSTKTLEAAILQASKSTGLRLTTSALCRMLRDFNIVPKLTNDQTVQVLVNMVALANTEGTKGENATVVLTYESKYDLNKIRRKRPRYIALKQVKGDDENKSSDKTGRGIPKRPNSSGGSRSSSSIRKGSSRGSSNRPRSGGAAAAAATAATAAAAARAGSGGKYNLKDVFNIDFYEFVDCLGRIAIIACKLNPGGIKNAPTNLRLPADIIASFFRHQMCLFEGSTLKKEAGWRRTVRRPWEAHDRERRMASPKAMMRPPLPGDPYKLMDRAASKGRLHIPHETKDPRLPQFKLTSTGIKELHGRHWTRSLKQIFDFYRKINTVIKKQKVISSGTGGDLFSDIVGMNNIITLSDFLKFLSDFKICPQVLHKDLISDIFLTATKKKKALDSSSSSSSSSSKKKGGTPRSQLSNGNTAASPFSSPYGSPYGSPHSSRPSSATRNGGKKLASTLKTSGRPTTAPLNQKRRDSEKWSLMGATWDDFLECIGRCAIAADFSEPAQYVGDVDKIIGFMVSLELDEGGDWRKKMRSYGSPSLKKNKRTTQIIRDSTVGKGSHSGIPLVRIGASGSPARGAGLRAVRAATQGSRRK